MTKRLCLFAVLTCLAWAAPSSEQTTPSHDVDGRIVQFEQQKSELMANLEYLCDTIGPRLTGSANLVKANEWTAQKMREYGLQNVRLEKSQIPVGWQRGKVEAEMIAPRQSPISAAAAAWTPGTQGTVTGPVIYVDARPDGSDLDRFKGKLRNAIVLLSVPSGVNNHPSLVPPGLRAPLGGTDEVGQPRPRSGVSTQFLKDEGAAAVLTDAGKPQMLLNMSGSWAGARGPALLPRLFVAHEHYAMLYRLVQKGVPVRMRLRVDSRFVKGPITVYNTVGEIPGTDKSDEMVLCGAHLDSWDLGTGAVDDGTGSMTVLETARILTSLGLKPRRTIRFALFFGEEEGLVGSRAYVQQHQSELSKVSAVFIHDTGTGRVNGIGLHGNAQVQPILQNEIPTLRELGVKNYSTFLMFGTDHASFAIAGVPSFWFMQDSADYGWMHHTQSDTFDKALPEDLVQGAAVMALCAYHVAQRDDLLPRRSTGTGAGAGR